MNRDKSSRKSSDKEEGCKVAAAIKHSNQPSGGAAAWTAVRPGSAAHAAQAQAWADTGAVGPYNKFSNAACGKHVTRKRGMVQHAWSLCLPAVQNHCVAAQRALPTRACGRYCVSVWRL